MFKLQPSARIRAWRDFRNDLGNMSFEQALDSTREFWAHAPFTPYYLDPDGQTEWPDPWTLIIENYYCDIAKTLGIVYTIALSEHGKSAEPEIRIYYDPTTRLTYNLAVFNQGKYVVNFIEGEIVNIESIDKKLKLKHQFSVADLKIEEY